MNTKHSDLIAIANADLALKLTRGRARQEKLKADADAPKKGTTNANSKASLNSAARDNATNDATGDKLANQNSFKEDVWRAVYVLNIMRYALGLLLLVLVTASAIDSDWAIFNYLSHPKLFFISSLVLLGSAILFSYISNNREVDFNLLVTCQFLLDVVLAACLTHSTGSVDSNFVILYMVVVATGSVVLPRKHAAALAAGAIIALFAEHILSLWIDHVDVEPHYSLLATYGMTLFACSLLIAYLAERIRIAELKNFVPGNENIEDFLVREEINALQSALAATDGNKTEAAKLLGMSFRSFRYKLTKYDIS